MKTSHTYGQKATATFLMAALLWLTVSTSFVLSSQQELGKQYKMMSAQSSFPDNSDDASSDANNNLEEKVPGANNLPEEFLHECGCNHLYFTIVSLYNKIENAANYIAFHGELLVHPPNSLV